jgi:hypothetical protein
MAPFYHANRHARKPNSTNTGGTCTPRKIYVMKQNKDLHKMRRGISSEVRFKLLLRCIARGVVCTLSTPVKRRKIYSRLFWALILHNTHATATAPFAKKDVIKCIMSTLKCEKPGEPALQRHCLKAAASMFVDGLEALQLHTEYARSVRCTPEPTGALAQNLN